MKWTHSFPVWVSRKDTNGMIASFTMPLWCALSLFALIVLNVLLWGGIGVYEAVTYII